MARGSAGRLDRRRSGGLHRSDGHRSRSPGWRKGQAQLRSVRLSPWREAGSVTWAAAVSRFDDQEFAAPMARLSCLIATYEAASATDLLAEGILARMLAGLSTRNYGAGLEPVGSHRGASRLHEPRRGQPPLCHGHRGAAIQLLGRRLDDPPLPCVDARRLEHGRAPPRGSPGH